MCRIQTLKIIHHRYTLHDYMQRFSVPAFTQVCTTLEEQGAPICVSLRNNNNLKRMCTTVRGIHQLVEVGGIWPEVEIR